MPDEVIKNAGESPKANAHVHLVKGRDEYHNPVRQVKKADTPTHLTKAEDGSGVDWVEPPIDLVGLKNLVDGSSILPQCISAYRGNIAGFGLGVRYKEDEDETEEMIAEFDYAKKIIDLLNLDKDTKEVFEELIECRETYGIGYIECIRNLEGVVVEICNIDDVPSVRKSRMQADYVDITYSYKGDLISRKKRFRKYKQEIAGKTVYFREFGDPRMMDNRTGAYIGDGEVLDVQYQANELLEFSVGSGHYGLVRWIGQVLGVDGSRMAEELNNNYFRNGRHTPMLISISGGTLSDDSWAKLQEYMDGIKGAAGQHAFMVLEVESKDTHTSFEQENPVKVEVKDLAAVLQKDELFQGYLDNNRRRVQSAFLLPDVYVAYTTDYNRATAQTAMEVTEKQVFQPERKSLAWAINNKLLNSYGFKYIEIFFEEPDLTDPTLVAQLLTVAGNNGGITPNKAKQIAYEALGEDAEDYDEDWGEIPLAIQQVLKSAILSAPGFGTATPNPPTTALEPEKIDAGKAEAERTDREAEELTPEADEFEPMSKAAIAEQVSNAIRKELSSQTTDNAVVAVMKEVKALILKMQEDKQRGAEADV